MFRKHGTADFDVKRKFFFCMNRLVIFSWTSLFLNSERKLFFYNCIWTSLFSGAYVLSGELMLEIRQEILPFKYFLKSPKLQQGHFKSSRKEKVNSWAYSFSVPLTGLAPSMEKIGLIFFEKIQLLTSSRIGVAETI